MKTNAPAHLAYPLRHTKSSRTALQMLGLLAVLPLAHAEIIEFDLSPSGFDTAVGLSAANEVPPNASTGSGNEISGGITFNTETSTLTLTMGYGSAAGFTDLTGPVTGTHIHAPADPGTNADVLFNLGSIHFPSETPATGGVIFGSVVYAADKVEDLIAGLNYVNIHTDAYPGGEIRGQLIPLINRAPQIICPPAEVVECGEAITYYATVSDIDGDAMQVVWSLNGETLQTDNIEAGEPPTSTLLEFTAMLPLGENSLMLTATDSAGNVYSCSTVITVEDTIPPVIDSLVVNPSVLWPPNHQMVRVGVLASVSDACGPTTWKIVSISSSEAVDVIGSGNTEPDWEILSDSSANLRAERSGTNKEGRTYTITVQAEDAGGNLSEPATVGVFVPHSQAPQSTAMSKLKAALKSRRR